MFMCYEDYGSIIYNDYFEIMRDNNILIPVIKLQNI